MQLRHVAEPAVLDPTQWFQGRSAAYGILEDRRGRLKRRFRAEIEGSWEGPVFVMRELFEHDDGTREHRTWRLERLSADVLRGTCEDMIGVAHCTCLPGMAQLAYKLRIPVKGRTIPIRFNDRLIEMADGSVLNRSTMFLAGLRVGELTFHFHKLA